MPSGRSCPECGETRSRHKSLGTDYKDSQQPIAVRLDAAKAAICRRACPQPLVTASRVGFGVMDGCEL